MGCEREVRTTGTLKNVHSKRSHQIFEALLCSTLTYNDGLRIVISGNDNIFKSKEDAAGLMETLEYELIYGELEVEGTNNHPQLTEDETINIAELGGLLGHGLSDDQSKICSINI